MPPQVAMQPPRLPGGVLSPRPWALSADTPSHDRGVPLPGQAAPDDLLCALRSTPPLEGLARLGGGSKGLPGGRGRLPKGAAARCACAASGERRAVSGERRAVSGER